MQSIASVVIDEAHFPESVHEERVVKVWHGGPPVESEQMIQERHPAGGSLQAARA